MPRYYRVSAGRAAAYLSEALDEGFIGVGWLASVDLTGEFPDNWRDFNAKYIPLVKEIDGATTNIGAGLACGQMWTVCRGMEVGDVVLTPTGKSSYRVGTVTGPYFYAAGRNLPHRRPVTWRGEELERGVLSETLRNSLGSVATVVSADPYQEELDHLLGGHIPSGFSVEDPDVEDPMSFVLEKHLEDFLVANWSGTELGKRYDIYTDEDGGVVGQQYPTDTGPIDILAVSKDRAEILVLELKRGRVSDVVVGQILRYMGFVRDLEPDKAVKGVIIGLDDDMRFKRAISMVPDLSFYRYEVKFQLKLGS